MASRVGLVGVGFPVIGYLNDSVASQKDSSLDVWLRGSLVVGCIVTQECESLIEKRLGYRLESC